MSERATDIIECLERLPLDAEVGVDEGGLELVYEPYVVMLEGLLEQARAELQRLNGPAGDPVVDELIKHIEELQDA